MWYLFYELKRPNVSDLKRKHDLKGLTWALGSSDDRIYGEAVSALAQMGQSAVPMLSGVLSNSQDQWLRRKNAALSLGRMTCSPDPTVLIAALDDLNYNVQQGAIAALGDLHSIEAVPSLVALLRDVSGRWFSKAMAVHALYKIGGDDALEALEAFKHRLLELTESLESNNSVEELSNLYSFLLRRHLAITGERGEFEDMKPVMRSALQQLVHACENGI